MSTWTLLASIWAVSAIAMAVVWAISMRARNIGYVDVAWAGLMAVAALLVGALGEGAELPRGLVALLGSLWGARLCLHLLTRVLHEPEDGRYQALRESWNGSPVKFFVFFQMQAVVVVFFALPFLAAASRHHNQFCAWTVAAVATWLVAVAGESAGRPPTGGVPRRSRQSRQDLPQRALGLVTPSQLLLRMAALVHLCFPRRRQPPVPG